MKSFTAQSSDLGGATNPAGLWSPSYLALKLALDRNDTPDNVLNALYDWLGRRGIPPSKVDNILQLSDMNAAYEALIGLIGAGLKPGTLSKEIQGTVHAAIQRLAQKYADRGELELDAERRRLLNIRTKFTGGAPSESVVNDLLR